MVQIRTDEIPHTSCTKKHHPNPLKKGKLGQRWTKFLLFKGQGDVFLFPTNTTHSKAKKYTKKEKIKKLIF